jgi:hypothetical protein
MRHAFRILAELGAECDRLGVRAVDVHGESGPASEFLAKIIHYIEARERECDRPTLTDADREAVEYVAVVGRVASDLDREVLRGLLERSGPSRAKKASSAARIKASPPPPADLVDALHDAVTPTSGRRLSAKPFGGKRRN